MFSACDPTATSNDCRRSSHIADLRDPKLFPRKLPVAWPAAVAWDADSAGLSTTEAIALARAHGVKDVRRSCLLHVKIALGEVQPIVCAEDASDTALAVSPDRQRASFFVSKGEPPERSFTVRSCSLSKGECGAAGAIPQLVEAPLLTDDGFVHSALIRGIPWSLRLEPREELLVGEEGWTRDAHRLDAQTFARIALFRHGYAIRTISGTAALAKP